MSSNNVFYKYPLVTFTHENNQDVCCVPWTKPLSVLLTTTSTVSLVMSPLTTCNVSDPTFKLPSHNFISFVSACRAETSSAQSIKGQNQDAERTNAWAQQTSISVNLCNCTDKRFIYFRLPDHWYRITAVEACKSVTWDRSKSKVTGMFLFRNWARTTRR